MSKSRHESRIALVLGGGWKLGASFHAGVVLALRDVWGVDARSVGSITGTSAGAVTAGFVGAQLDPDELFGREIRGGSTPDLDDDPHRATESPPAPGSADGRADEHAARRSLGDYFDELTEGNWPSAPNLRLCAVDVRSGRLTAFDRDSGTSPGAAIAASCSIPGLARPVRIGDRSYVDGAFHSANNAHSVASCDADIVVISAPMSVDRPMLSFGPSAIVRNSIRAQTARERKKLSRDHRVVTIEPSRSDVAAMGLNLNDADRREHVARHAYATACQVFDRERFLSPIR